MPQEVVKNKIITAIRRLAYNLSNILEANRGSASALRRSLDSPTACEASRPACEASALACEAFRPANFSFPDASIIGDPRYAGRCPRASPWNML
jgi:hypothetical protein